MIQGDDCIKDTLKSKGLEDEWKRPFKVPAVQKLTKEVTESSIRSGGKARGNQTDSIALQRNEGDS